MTEGPSGGIISSIKAEVEKHLEARLQLAQLEATEKMALLAGKITVAIVSGVFLLLALLSLSLMAGFWISQVLNSNWYGFAIVAGFYLLLSILIMAGGKKKLATFIADKIVAIIFEKTDNRDPD